MGFGQSRSGGGAHKSSRLIRTRKEEEEGEEIGIGVVDMDHTCSSRDGPATREDCLCQRIE